MKKILLLCFIIYGCQNQCKVYKEKSAILTGCETIEKVYGDVENWVAVGCGSKYCCSHLGIFNNYNCSLCPNQGNK